MKILYNFFKVQLTRSLVFVSNYLPYNIKHFCENVFFILVQSSFFLLLEIRKVSSILVHWPRLKGTGDNCKWSPCQIINPKFETEALRDNF